VKFDILGPLAGLDRRSAISWLVLRVLLATFIAAHGWARLIAGGVVPFGGWLEGQGIPAGLIVASAITMIEIIGTPLLALGRLVPLLSMIYSCIYLVGIFLVHLPAGWFVVGLGRNGAEYSVLLIACLVLVGIQHQKRDENIL